MVLILWNHLSHVIYTSTGFKLESSPVNRGGLRNNSDWIHRV